MSPRRRVLVVQLSLQPPGGGQAIAAWMVEALKAEHDVTVCSQVPVDLDPINRFYGTSIEPSEVTLICASSAAVRLLERLPLRLALLRAALFRRQIAPILAGRYDVVISGNNEADFGRPGIQYIHYPWTLRPRPDLSWYHRTSLLRVYYRVCDALTGYSADRARLNVSLVNSDWTGALVSRQLRADTRTLYPPVITAFPAVPWAERRDGFICLGRISPEKELERVVEILAAVHSQVPYVRLHLVGTSGDRRAYYRRIRRLVRQHAGWISLHEDLPRDQLVRLAASQRYGIHGMREEHFGIAVAELVSAGCIVFVPDGGGQVEIVGRDPRFLYRTVDEAVAKIVRVLQDPAEQDRLRAALDDRHELYSIERFTRSVRQVVAEFPRSAG